jgi:hypothetical protein
MHKRITSLLLTCAMLIFAGVANAWIAKPVIDDPLVRMPGTQPDQGVNLESPNRCLNCHAGYNQSVEPGFNWMGSMMAQAARDPIFWSCLTVAGQDSIWALGNPNAVDLCERCHFPGGWMAGRSDPPNASHMTGSDFDGLHCDFCHRMSDPFFEDTFAGTREGSDWTGYWDEATSLSLTEAQKTLDEDRAISQAISLFSGSPTGFYGDDNRPVSDNYTESTSGQFFVSPNSQKRASFADAGAKHQMLYSRFHKSKYFCATCHDVSNPALANLGLSGLEDDGSGNLITEQYSAGQYFHVERTFSEFMLSAYGQPGGAPTNPDFQAQGAPDITHAAKCQDCHMRDVTGAAANKGSAVVRPDNSSAHPDSGLPLHDLTGGNAWISYILASLDPNGPVYDPINAQLLNQGPSILTLDLTAGQTPVQNGAALKAGSDRAKQQLLLAATLKDLTYNAGTGALSFKVQNNTGHKLISGFPEGRRMFVNIKAYQAGNLIYEVNPYDATAGTLKGLPDSPNSPALGPNEAHVDKLVYEVHPTSSLTGEAETFHFVLATGRYKDNRIPPKGFDIAAAAARISEPVWHGVNSPGYFSAEEYANGYDAQTLTIPAGADNVEVTLYYQGTSREYVEFLRDEIKGTGDLTLPDPVAGTPENEAYLIQTDPFFSQLAAWGDTIWQLWQHNHAAGVEGITPFAMTQATWGTPTTCDTPTPTLLSASDGSNLEIDITWQEVAADGYRLYYDQAGKAQLIVDLQAPASTYTDTGLTDGQEYCYKVTAYTGCESGYSTVRCATATQPGQQTTVPGVIGLTPTAAETAILAAELVVGNTSEVYDIADTKGLVISQDPAADSQAPLGSAVDLVVSLGQAPAVICADIVDKSTCINEPTCEWQGSPKNGSCVDAVTCTPVVEGPFGDATCSDGIDNDCDTLIDSNDPDCQASGACNNNGVCDSGEDCLGCAGDCAGVSGGKPAGRYCCGNGVTEPAEGDGTICDGNF